MKHFITLALSTVVTCCLSQDYKTEFDRYCQEGDTLKQKEVLVKWESEDPDNPELYTCYFNYYFQKSRREVLSLTVGEPQGQSLFLQDSAGNTTGYLGSQIDFDEQTAEMAFDKIDQGIKLHPDRLDMRFGKIYVLGEMERWGEFTDEIVKTIQHSARNDNKWTWTNSEPKDNGKVFFLSALQEYQLRLYNTGEDALLGNMRTIALEVLKLYPDHVESLSNLSITYLLTGDYENALAVLLRAEKIASKDEVILSNLAQGYKLKGDKRRAIEYYEKTIKYGGKEIADYAREQIRELRK